MANWSDLSLDLLVSIANRMDLVEDCIAFGLVCKPWRSAAARENFTGGLTHQVPWLLLHPTKNSNAGNSVVEFYNMRKGKTHKLSLAEESKRNEVRCSSLGWLITLSEDFEVSLLHPLNHRPIVKLPNFPIEDQLSGLNNFALSSSPSSTSDYIVMAIYDIGCRLSFCRPGDDGWTKVAREKLVYCYTDVTYYKGQFHAVGTTGRVFVCDIGKAKTRVIIDKSVPKRHRDCFYTYYLVESRGVLLAVQRVFRGEPVEFRVFEVPFSNGNWSDSEVTNLGSRTLFIDRTRLFCIEASTYSSCEKNCIYHSCGGIKEGISIFTMADNIIKTNMGGYSGSQFPDLWIQPSL